MSESGTINGVLPDPEEPKAKRVKKWLKGKKSLSRRAIIGVALLGAIAGGVMEKNGANDQVADLQGQIAALQDASDTTGTSVPATADGAVTVTKKLPGQSGVKKPKALSPSQHKYQCTRVG
jgi:hypothetical protein